MKNPVIKNSQQLIVVIDNTVEQQMEKERLEIERDKEILAIREKFDAGDEETSGLKFIGEAIQTNLAMIEEYARANRAELLAETNKSETSFAIFGFRIGNPALALLSEKWTWDKVVAAIKEKFGKKAPQFIRVKEEPDKAALKNHLDDAGRKSIGTVLERKETFFVDPKRDPADPHRLVASSSS
jgi:phage host-nuclease inhibitor protein Gam